MPQPPKPPTGQKGNIGQFPTMGAFGGALPSWGMFRPEDEAVTELLWPQSVIQYDRMLNESQVWSLFLGTALPLLTYNWWLDGEGADADFTAALAADLGLPTKAPEDEEDSHIEPGRFRFNFGEHLWEALLALPFGHAYFEQVGVIDEPGDGLWHLAKLGSLPQRTIYEIFVDPNTGGLRAIRQNGVSTVTRGRQVFPVQPQPITVDRLLVYVFLPDGRRRWTGRSMLRPIYREWLVKDRLLRVDAINHERAGGMHGFETDETFAGASLQELQQMASAMRVGEESGWAAPPGAKLVSTRLGGTDVVASMKYHDESMARAWQAMVAQLGQTMTGSRALGGTFADLEALFRRAVADWFRGTFREHMIEDWWGWNVPRATDGAPSPHPVLRWKAPAIEGAEPPPPTSPGGGGPPPVAARRPSPRRAEHGAAAGAGSITSESAASVKGDRGQPGELQTPTATAAHPAVAVHAAASLPARPLRRQPYEHELRAAVDFAALDIAYDTTVSSVEGLFVGVWLPQQVAAVADGIRLTKAGTERTRVTRADMARVRAPVMGADDLAGLLLIAARAGALAAADEMLAQGVPVLAPTEDMLLAAVADHARAVAQQIADGLSIAASRRAVSLVGERSAREIADETSAYLHGLEHRWERDQLAGAVQQASNGGRFLVFDRVPSEVAVGFHASELLDASTCDRCLEADGREYPDLAAATRDYPSGGFKDCRGGPRCRGTVVAVLAEAEQFSGDPAHLGPG